MNQINPSLFSVPAVAGFNDLRNKDQVRHSVLTHKATIQMLKYVAPGGIKDSYLIELAIDQAHQELTIGTQNTALTYAMFFGVVHANGSNPEYQRHNFLISREHGNKLMQIYEHYSGSNIPKPKPGIFNSIIVSYISDHFVEELFTRLYLAKLNQHAHKQKSRAVILPESFRRKNPDALELVEYDWIARRTVRL